jgi:hypothetical protein
VAQLKMVVFSKEDQALILGWKFSAIPCPVEMLVLMKWCNVTRRDNWVLRLKGEFKENTDYKVFSSDGSDHYYLSMECAKDFLNRSITEEAKALRAFFIDQAESAAVASSSSSSSSSVSNELNGLSPDDCVSIAAAKDPTALKALIALKHADIEKARLAIASDEKIQLANIETKSKVDHQKFIVEEHKLAVEEKKLEVEEKKLEVEEKKLEVDKESQQQKLALEDKARVLDIQMRALKDKRITRVEYVSTLRALGIPVPEKQQPEKRKAAEDEEDNEPLPPAKKPRRMTATERRLQEFQAQRDEVWKFLEMMRREPGRWYVAPKLMRSRQSGIAKAWMPAARFTIFFNQWSARPEDVGPFNVRQMLNLLRSMGFSSSKVNDKYFNQRINCLCVFGISEMLPSHPCTCALVAECVCGK